MSIRQSRAVVAVMVLWVGGLALACGSDETSEGSGGGGAAGASGSTGGTGGGTSGTGGGSAGTGTGGTGGTTTDAGVPIGTGESTSQVIGATGGSITFEGVTVTVPAGAVAGDTIFKITSLTETADMTSGEALTPVYKFEPDGITFAQPLTVTMTVPSTPPGDALLAWTASGGVALQPLASTVSGTEVSGSVTHFCCGLTCSASCAGVAPAECGPPAP